MFWSAPRPAVPMSHVVVSGTSLTVTNTFGAHLYATVAAVNNAGIESSASAARALRLVNPAWIPVASMADKNLLNCRACPARRIWSGPRPTGRAVHRVQRRGDGDRADAHVHQQPHQCARYFKVQLFP